MSLRRFFLLSLVAATALICFGCASPALQCDMRDDYANTPPPRKGSVQLAWALDQGFTDNRYGETYCGPETCVVRLKGIPTFNDTCSLARLGHEVVHAMRRDIGAH